MSKDIELELNKDVNYNANKYFERAKKLKSKIKGVDFILNETQKKIDEIKKNKNAYLDKKKKEEILNLVQKKELQWYEKFRWTKLVSGHIFVIGKDSSSNEILIKKYATNKDLILHSLYPGSPFGLIKDAIINENLKINEEDIYDAGQFLLSFSNAWKNGIAATDFFWVKYEQVSKTPKSGEYLKKGSFIINGKKNIIKNVPLQICLGFTKEEIEIEDNRESIVKVMSGSKRICKKFCNKFITLEPGSMKYKELIKRIKKKLGIHIDELPKYIPNYCKIKKL